MRTAAAVIALGAAASVNGFVPAEHSGAVRVRTHAQSIHTSGTALRAATVQTTNLGRLTEEDDIVEDKESDASLAAEFTKRFGHLKGQAVRTVSDAVKIFCDAYPRPVVAQYRTLVQELIQSTHLTVVDARFQYDAVFGVGLFSLFYKLMKSYPGEGEADKIFIAISKALSLDHVQMKADAERLLAWAKTENESEIESAFRGEGDSEIAKIANTARADKFYLYSKMWSLGLVQLLEAAGIEVTEDKMENLMTEAGFGDFVVKVNSDFMQYKDTLDKAAQAEVLFREIEIREKKKMAERLEEKAKRALAKAEAADKAAADGANGASASSEA